MFRYHLSIFLSSIETKAFCLVHPNDRLVRKRLPSIYRRTLRFKASSKIRAGCCTLHSNVRIKSRTSSPLEQSLACSLYHGDFKSKESASPATANKKFSGSPPCCEFFLKSWLLFGNSLRHFPRFKRPPLWQRPPSTSIRWALVGMGVTVSFYAVL